jgi:hypothetical protein
MLLPDRFHQSSMQMVAVNSDNSDAERDLLVHLGSTPKCGLTPETGHIFYADVVVTHPPFSDKVIVHKDVALDVAVLEKKYKRI